MQAQLLFNSSGQVLLQQQVLHDFARVAFADNDSIDTAYGTAVVVQDDAQGAVEELLVSAESGAVTIARFARRQRTYLL